MGTAEQETIGLCIALEAVNNIANKELLEVLPLTTGEAEVCFKTEIHQEIFLARLLDFSEEPGDRSVTGVTGSCLDVLRL